jgi:hypothetical protein
VDGIYILGSGLDALGIIAVLEPDLGFRSSNRLWCVCRKFTGALRVREPIKGNGSLLETLPA